jgi:hypothetical protein
MDSLAAWPVLNGLVFTLRSVGFALNEVVVALLDRPRAYPALRRFALLLAACSSTVLLVTAATPLGGFWFGRVSALPPHLVALARGALWLAFVLPGLSALQSLYQGVIVYGRRTRAVTESVAAYLAVSAVVLAAGVAAARAPGIHVAALALATGTAAQVAWLAWRARALRHG